jgi:hypothetical protein
MALTRTLAAPMRAVDTYVTAITDAGDAPIGAHIDALGALLRRWHEHVVADQHDHLVAAFARLGRPRSERLARWLSRHADSPGARHRWAGIADTLE